MGEGTLMWVSLAGDNKHHQDNQLSGGSCAPPPRSAASSSQVVFPTAACLQGGATCHPHFTDEAKYMRLRKFPKAPCKKVPAPGFESQQSGSGIFLSRCQPGSGCAWNFAAQEAGKPPRSGSSVSGAPPPLF